MTRITQEPVCMDDTYLWRTIRHRTEVFIHFSTEEKQTTSSTTTSPRTSKPGTTDRTKITRPTTTTKQPGSELPAHIQIINQSNNCWTFYWCLKSGHSVWHLFLTSQNASNMQKQDLRTIAPKGHRVRKPVKKLWTAVKWLKNSAMDFHTWCVIKHVMQML